MLLAGLCFVCFLFLGLGAALLPGSQPAQTTLPLLRKLGVQFVLASASPRRKELLEQCLQVTPRVAPSSFAEDLDKKAYRTAAAYCAATARCKGQDVVDRGLVEPSSSGETQVIISADTIVVCGCHDVILEKPTDKADAMRMLSLLAGKQHTVHTAVALFVRHSTSPTFSLECEFVESTLVKFNELTSMDIEAYVDANEVMDKAGSYGIQGAGALLVRTVSGCFYNVMGLPVSRLSAELAKILAR